LRDPPGNFTLNGKRPLRFHLEAAAQIVSVDFERYAILSATSEETADVQFRETRNPDLPVLLDMDEFVKQ
jgi:hypothetical protein